MPFDEAGDGEIFVLFGAGRANYHAQVPSAVQAVGTEYEPETCARLLEAIDRNPRRVA